jgi:hypothetical protein
MILGDKPPISEVILSQTSSGGGEAAISYSSLGDDVDGSFGNQFFVVLFLGFRFLHT